MIQQPRQFEDVFPITFEGVELPAHTCFIDVLVFYGIIPEVSEETVDWLWRFTICSGRTRTSESVSITKHIDELLSLIAADQRQITERLLKQYEGTVDASSLMEEWVGTLQLIKNIAASTNKNSCTWEGSIRS